jgi:UDP:flavonoid glycosyltransferase YjiC (YdhE family)
MGLTARVGFRGYPRGMFVIFASAGGFGHAIPLLPLATAVRRAGHRVVFATSGNLHPMLRDSGLEPITAGSPLREAIEAARATSPAAEASAVAFGRILPRLMASDLAPFLAEHRPDLVVYEALAPGAAIAAAEAGIPALCHALGRLTGGPIWRGMADTWRATAAEYGIAVPDRDVDFFGNQYIDICPPSLQLPGFTTENEPILMRPATWRPAGPLPPLLHERKPERPLVYLTLGTAFGTAAVLTQAIDGLSRLPADVLVADGASPRFRAGLGDVPSNVTLAGWVPQGAVVPHADLVVSHGGSGTMLDALAAGLPQLTLPQGADQFANAHALAEAGTGTGLMPAELTADAVHAEASRLLDDPVVQAAAAQIAKEIREMPAPDQIAARLPEWT